MAIAALLVGGLVCAGACSGRHDDARAVHFLAWKPQQPGPLEEAIGDFERASGIRVVRHIGSENASQYYSELTTKLRNHDPALDVFFLDVVWPAEFAARGYLADLTGRLPPAERELFLPGPMAACTVAGRVVAVPFDVDVGLLYYRRDLLEKYNLSPPATWAELLEQIDAVLAGEKQAHPSMVGYAAQFRRYEGLVCNMLEMVAGRGGALVDETGKPVLDTPAVIGAVRWVRDRLLLDPQHPRRAPRTLLNATEQESRAIFARGDALFHRNWPETWNILNDPERSSVAGRVGMAPLPAGPGGRSAGTLGGWELAISSYSPRTEQAWRFVRYLTSHAVQKKLAIELAQPMARTSIYHDEELLSAVPHFGRAGRWGQPLLRAALSAVPRPALARYSVFSDRLQQCLHDAISAPESNIEAIMSDCEQRIRDEIGDP
ncbi:MAG: ABC transporter substrate-binding protein [Acidobacteriota bacterium]